jgi:Trk K+ transport system NAD-binding subunit
MLTSGHAIVCGLDHLGLRTVDELRLRDETVVAIGDTDEAAEHLGELGVRLVVGDHRLPRVLREAGAASASVLVLTGDDDLGNLNTALAAAEINPGIRVVIRMFDQELGAHIPELFPDAVALSSSAVAAPGFVSAAIDGETGSRFRLAGRVLTSRRSGDTAAGPVSIPIARLRADRSVELFPDADPGASDLILIDVAGADAPDLEAPAGAIHRDPGLIARLRGRVADVRARLSSPERRFVRFAAILLGLALASAIFFYVVAGLGPLDAVSYAITLLTGASLPTDIASAATNVPLRIYAILLSLVGAAIVAVVYAFITDALIRSRLLQTLGRRTVPGNIRDHVIVAGLGSIGYRVALGLRARGVPVVIVEVSDDSRFVSPARAAGIPVFVGDARHREVLDELRLGSARALVAATSDDLVNLSVALNARAVRPDLRVVVRVYDPDFAIRVQHGFHIRFTRSVSHLAAPAFAAAAVGSEVVATVPVGDRRVVLFARLRVPAGSMLEGRLASTLDTPGALKLLAVADPGSEEARWDYPIDEVLDAGEEVVVAATRAGLGELLHHASMVAGSVTVTRDENAKTDPPVDHGLTAIGSAVAGAAVDAATRTVGSVASMAAGGASGAMAVTTKAASGALGAAGAVASGAANAAGAVSGAIAGAVGGGSGPMPAGTDDEDLAETEVAQVLAPDQDPTMIDRTELGPTVRDT